MLVFGFLRTLLSCTCWWSEIVRVIRMTSFSFLMILIAELQSMIETWNREEPTNQSSILKYFKTLNAEGNNVCEFSEIITRYLSCSKFHRLSFRFRVSFHSLCPLSVFTWKSPLISKTAEKNYIRDQSSRAYSKLRFSFAFEILARIFVFLFSNNRSISVYFLGSYKINGFIWFHAGLQRTELS